MTWLLYAFSAVVMFTLLNLLQRTIATESENPRAMAIVFNVIALVMAILIFLFTGSYQNFQLPTNPSAYLAIGAAVMFYGLFERGRFYTAKLLDASVLTTILNISVLVSFSGALILYQEPLTLQKLLGGGLIITALLLTTYTKKPKASSAKGILLAVAISICLGLAGMLDKLGTMLFNAETYNIFVWSLPLLFIMFPLIKFSDLNVELKQSSWKIIVIAGANVIGYLFQLKALELAEATKVIPIVQTTTLATVFMGIVLLKERDHLVRKIAAGLLAFTGVILLV